MTATLSRRRESAGSAYVIERLADPDQIRQALNADRAYAAYAIAQLEPERFALSEWFAARGRDGQAGLVVHSSSGLGRALFAQGDPEVVDSILSLHPGSRFSFGSLRPEHRRAVEKYFVMTRHQMMVRMAVTEEAFTPVDGEAIRLAATNLPAINRLYSTEGVPTAYRPSHLEEGVYYGVIEAGRLVSIAGTHVVSACEGVAVVGNVFTHPHYRGRGFATITTSAVTGELLRSCPLVVLTVETANEPALAVYGRLGYQASCSLHESPLIRKEPVGALSMARRLLAGWRGRSEGKEVVLR